MDEDPLKQAIALHAPLASAIQDVPLCFKTCPLVPVGKISSALHATFAAPFTDLPACQVLEYEQYPS